MKGSNNVAIGYDEGSIMIKLGREEPAMSMDSSGKELKGFFYFLVGFRNFLFPIEFKIAEFNFF